MNISYYFDSVSKNLEIKIIVEQEEDIKYLYIDSEDTYLCKNEHSSTPVYKHEDLVIKDNEINLIIPYTDILVKDVDNALLFIYLENSNHIMKNTAPTSIYNNYVFFHTLLDSIDVLNASSEDLCNPACAFVDYLIAWDGLRLALGLYDYSKAIEYWEILHNKVSSTSKNCNCK